MNLIVPLDASAISTAITNALTEVKADVTTYIGDVLPYALGIMGIVVAITIGIRFFKKIAR